ncbi:MAG: polysaccharide deacetylase family protein [Hyphomicrobium sp.]|nr:polysaccharide deacetylase family protein [Hyphomicrobium sp.]
MRIAFAGLFLVSGGAKADPLCWRPEDLVGKAGEQSIRNHGSALAYRSVPTGVLRVPALPRPPAGTVIRRFELPGDQKIVALTFDLCEQPHEITGYQGEIVDYLRKNGIRATFFASGKWIVTHEERAQQLLSDPLFEVGNHTWEHRNLAMTSAEATLTEIAAAQLAYQNAYDNLARRQCLARDGQSPAHDLANPEQRLLRFPYGSCSAAAIGAVERLGLVPVQWDVSSADPWKGQTVENMVKYVVSNVKSGSIVLFHANGRGWRTEDALPRIVDALRARGFSFARVGDLLTMDGAKPVMSELCYDRRPHDLDRYNTAAAKLERQYDAFYKRLKKPPPHVDASNDVGSSAPLARPGDGEVLPWLMPKE